jgi:hypothetical protein
MLGQAFSRRQRLIFGQCCKKSTARTEVITSNGGPEKRHGFPNVSNPWAQIAISRIFKIVGLECLVLQRKTLWHRTNGLGGRFFSLIDSQVSILAAIPVRAGSTCGSR